MESSAGWNILNGSILFFEIIHLNHLTNQNLLHKPHLVCTCTRGVWKIQTKNYQISTLKIFQENVQTLNKRIKKHYKEKG